MKKQLTAPWEIERTGAEDAREEYADRKAILRELEPKPSTSDIVRTKWEPDTKRWKKSRIQ